MLVFIVLLSKILIMNTTEKFKILLIAFILGISGGITGYWLMPSKTNKTMANKVEVAQKAQNVQFTNLNSLTGIPDFTIAAEKGTEAVVHIKTKYYDQGEDPVYNFFFGRPEENTPVQASGSGVIISTDGYIVTNNHVIENSSNIIVTMDDKTEYKAKIIGRDPSTDIALIKIDAKNLNTLQFGNSDNLKVGEWVLAIGNPFNLTSTVTAGIVSAKARSINILNKRYAIESFIQTDAAVNPGNSGGALITTDGKLIGINTAITSPTGSFAGYSFAIPASIVQKVVKDIIEFGEVQRAFIGAKIANIDDKLVQTFNLPNNKGVFINSVTDGGGAKDAGLKDEDVILTFDGFEVNELPQLLDLISRHRPGDKVIITYRRKNKINEVEITLKNKEGNTERIVNETNDIFGASFKNLSKEELSEYRISYGVKVSEVISGKFMTAGIRKGFIITHINERPIKDTKDIEKILKDIHGGVYIEGIYPSSGKKAYYAFGVK